MNCVNLQEKIRDYTAAHRAELLRDLAELVAVPSVAKPGKDGLPYGAECREVLRRAEAIARRMGFVTEIVDDAVLTVEFGDKPAQLCLMAHLDVVDAGEGWDSDPYTMVVTEERLVGRGVTDDKGPAIAALYAMDAIRRFCPDLPYGVQLWLGSAEEIGSPDLKQYLKSHQMPPIVLTPDSMEALCTGESAKHRPDFGAKWDKCDVLPRVVYLQGGKVRNAIPDYAEARVAGLTADAVRPIADAWSAQAEVSFELTDTDEGLVIRAYGVTAHIGIAQNGRNAQTALIALLSKLPLADCASERAICDLARLFPHGDMTGAAMGLTVADGIMGTSRTNFTTCTLDDEGFRGQFDSRGPTNATPENYSLLIDAALRGAGFTVAESQMDGAHYVPDDAPIVRAMQELWHQVWGFTPACEFSFGGTYAHYIDGAIAFGIAAPGVDTLLHKVGEFLPLADLDRQVELCALTMARLCRENPL